MVSVVDDDQAGWEEVVADGNGDVEKNDAVRTTDLFSDQVFGSAKRACEEMLARYDFDLVKICNESGGGLYGAIKIINYIRLQVKKSRTASPSATPQETSAGIISTVLSTPTKLAELPEEYLAPVIPSDPLIVYVTSLLDNFDEFSDDNDESDSDDGIPDFDPQDDVPGQNSGKSSEVQGVDSGPESVGEMVNKFSKLSTNAKEEMFEKMKFIHEENIHLKEMLKRCQGMLRSFVNNDNEKSVTSAGEFEPPNQDNDTYYFDSYSHYGIHETMLKDKSRTDAYKNAILMNKKLFDGKVVLDIGCGTGILSMFAADAGAKHVIGIDMSDMAFRAMEIVHANGFQDVITIVHGKVENIKLPNGIDKVDIIVSEWMGYALVYECMLETVLVARDRWLKPEGGVMFPNSATVHVGGLSDEQMWKDKVEYWHNVYGYNMVCMKKDVLQEAEVAIVNPEAIFTEMAPVWNLNIQTIKPSELDLLTEFKLHVKKEGRLMGFVIGFDCDFNEQCENPIVLKTGPESTPTHWKQTTVYLKSPSKVLERDTVISGVLEIKRNEKNPRFLDISVDLRESKHLLEDDGQEGGKDLHIYKYQLQ